MHFTAIIFSALLATLASADNCRSGGGGKGVSFSPSQYTCFRNEGVGKPDTLCPKGQAACGNTCIDSSGASNAQICIGDWGNRHVVTGNSRPSPPLDKCAGTTYNDVNYHCWNNQVACLQPDQIACGVACYAQFGQVGKPGYCCINNGLVPRTDPRCQTQSGIQ